MRLGEAARGVDPGGIRPSTTGPISFITAAAIRPGRVWASSIVISPPIEVPIAMKRVISCSASSFSTSST
jgi:hypothetical protein